MTDPAKDTATDPENDPETNTVPDVISGRTPNVIAAEINMIKYQAENIYLAATVEIGRRLTEAKSLLKFGEWGKWLEESVDFSQSRANKLMRIFKEYGEGQLTNSNSEPNPKLNYSQAVLLLGIPKEERAQFIVDMDVEGMTTQELRQAVKERTQARQEKDQAQQEKAEFQKTVEDQSGTITELTAELANLKAQLENVKASKEELAITARQLNDSLESLRKSSSTQSYERMRNNFMKSSIKVRANHLAFLCENLDQTVREVKQKLREIATNDKETYIIYKNKVCDLMDVWRKDEAWSREACLCGDGQ